MQNNKIYPSKLLLFGEYLIVRGGSALAIPLPIRGGQWRKDSAGDQYNLLEMATYLKGIQTRKKALIEIDVHQFVKDLSEGWYFDSNIPTGFGLGSSGALVAAIYDKYTNVDNYVDYLQLRGKLAKMEGFFHGQSSGVDPLVSYTQQALELLPNNGTIVHDIPVLHNEEYHFFLLDSGVSRETGPLVNIFLEKCNDKEYVQQLNDVLLVASDRGIQSLLQQDWITLVESFQQISSVQNELFGEMILPSVQPLWDKGLTTNDFYLKLCGAGGGGFYLGIMKRNKWNQYSALFEGFELIML